MDEKRVSFQFKELVLLEFSFQRERFFTNEEYQSSEINIHFELNHSINLAKELEVLLSVHLSHKKTDLDLVKGKASYVGIFTFNENASQENIEKFAKINAPAIIFPFIREVFASASLKALLPPILIQPINFVELSQKNS